MDAMVKMSFQEREKERESITGKHVSTHHKNIDSRIKQFIPGIALFDVSLSPSPHLSFSFSAATHGILLTVSYL